MRRALATLLVVAGASGCAGGDEPKRATYVDGPARLCYPSDGFARPPCGPGAEVGVFYAYGLSTHCGIAYAYFDDRAWLADPRLDDGSGNPPSRWANPRQHGFMGLLAHDEAEFQAGDLRARFKPAPASFRRPSCA